MTYFSVKKWGKIGVKNKAFIDASTGDVHMLYTVKNMVVENNELVYNDGVRKLIHDISPEEAKEYIRLN